MTGKIFISCGQRSQDEKEIAKAVSELLEKKLKFPPPYLAAKIDTFEEVLSIIKELASSDYFLFIDFKREVKKPENDLPCSLFSHQN